MPTTDPGSNAEPSPGEGRPDPAVEALRDREEQLRLILENIRDYAVISLDRAGVVVTWNDGAERVLGYREEEIRGQPGAVIFTAEDRAAGVPEQEMATALAEGRAEDERWHVREDGTRFWGSGLMMPLYDAPGAHRGFVKVMRDRSDQKREHDALEAKVAGRTRALREANRGRREARGLFETAFHASPVASAITRLADGLILDVNERFAEFFGYTPEELVGQTGIGTGLWADPADRVRLVREALAEGVVRDVEVAVRTRAGEGRVVQGSVAVIEVDGAPCALMSFVDVTRQRRLEEEALEAAEVERRRLAFELHDDVLQRLSGASMLSWTLAEGLRTGGHPATATADRVNELLRGTIHHVRALSRALAPVDLVTEGLGGALQRLCTSTEEAYGVRCTLAGGENALVEDPSVATHLFRIAQEAVSNAARHAEARAITVELVRGGGALRLTVRDDGRGLPGEARGGAGGGLGLRTMRARAAALGGALSFASTPSAGTTVTCTIPDPAGPKEP